MTPVITVKRESRSSGSVLILAVWVLFTLAVVAVVVATQVSSDLSLAGKLKDRTLTHMAARAAVEAVALEIGGDSNEWDSLDEYWGNNEELFKDRPLGGMLYSAYYVLIDSSGDSHTNYGVIDVESLISINKAKKEVLASAFMVIGGVDEALATQIAAATVDWRDKDDEPLTGGAESGYYSALSTAYNSRNADFQSVQELLLVKGMTPELYEKMAGYLTPFGKGKVNINTAGPMVLRAVAGAVVKADGVAQETLVDKILRYREAENAFTKASGADIVSKLSSFSELRPEERAVLTGMLRHISVRGSAFKGTAQGMANSGKGHVSHIDFVIDRETGNKLWWRED